jgi:hypothetical protein
MLFANNTAKAFMQASRRMAKHIDTDMQSKEQAACQSFNTTAYGDPTPFLPSFKLK